MTLRLPITSIERYHLADDTPENPNVIAAELMVSGEVDMDIATLALREATSRHLMLCAKLKRGFAGRRLWVLDKQHTEKMFWHEVDATSTAEDFQVIRPMNDLPSRCLIQRRGELTKLSFRTHHAAADGGGGLQLVADWLVTYHRISSGRKKPRSRETDHGLLKRRNNLRLLNRRFLAKIWIQPIALLGATKFLFRTVQSVARPIESSKSNHEPASNDYRILSRSFPVSKMDQLRSEAESNKATINEVFLKAVFLAINEYRRQHGLHKPGEWLRLIVPISIRDYADRRMPAANRATIIQLDRTDKDFADPAGMIWGLNYELGNIRSWNLEKTFLLAMRLVGSVPGLIGRTASKDVCRATSVVTNLGAPLERLKLERIDGKLRSGNLIVEDLDLIVPLRKRTPIGFAVSRYAGQLKINLHFDPKQIPKKQAQQILDLTLVHLDA